MHRLIVRALGTSTVMLACCLAAAAAASAGTVTMFVCNSPVALNRSPTGWTSNATGGIKAIDSCQGGGRMQISFPGNSAAATGSYGQWSTTLPAAMDLTGMDVPAGAGLIAPDTQNDGGSGGYNVRYLWDGGATEVPVAGNCCGGLNYAGATVQTIHGRYLIIQVACTKSSCNITGALGTPGDIFDIKNFLLTAADDTPPALSTPSQVGQRMNLWDAGKWVRGAFGLAFSAANPNASGVCGTGAYLDGTPLSGGAASPVVNTQWQQCAPTLEFSGSVDTSTLQDGEHSLALDSVDAASPANHGTVSRSFGVDNQAPTVSLPPTVQVAGNGSTTYVPASATAGPSGVRDISCSVDSAAAVTYPDPAAQSAFSAQVPVSGLGSHRVDCVSQNNAADSSGADAQSAPAGSIVSLREPTSSAVTFAQIADQARCHTVVHRRHGRRITIRACRARTIKRKETVTKIVKRHGRKRVVKVIKVVRVPVRPHVVLRTSERVRYGHATTISGALDTGSGALPNAPVSVLATPDNGSGAYTQIATAVTSAAGTWTAKIRPGPSRLIKVMYAGSATTYPAVSAPITLSVPANIRIASITPRYVPWGSKITITGKLAGGYLPAAGILVELRYSYQHARDVYGVKTHVTAQTFTTTFTFGAGAQHVRFGFQLATLPDGSYPYRPAASNTIAVHVGNQ
jgi:hypothetical protein